jgi:hypothetical protein
LINGVSSIRDTLKRLADIKKDLMRNKKTTRKGPRKGKRVKPSTPPN